MPSLARRHSDFLAKSIMNFSVEKKDLQVNSIHSDIDLVIKARMERSEIQMLCKLVEGLGHLGVVTTTDKDLGEVMIQTTRYCWPDLKKAVENMPFEIELI